MIVVESFGSIIRLTDEYLRVELGEATVRGLRERVADSPELREGLEGLLRWAEYPTVWVRDVLSVDVEAVPAVPGAEQLFRLHLVVRFRDSERTYDIHMAPEEAKKIASEMKSLIGKKF
jgi:hypothetical protein